MAIGEITNPYEFFTNADGTPLEAGQIFIGVDGLDPQDNPQAAYFDLAGTIGATQPIRTAGGYPVNAGSATKIFTDGSFSVKVLDENNNLVYSDLSVSQIEDNIDALTARIDEIAIPFNTVADLFVDTTTLATYQERYGSTGIVNVKAGVYDYTLDLAQAGSGAGYVQNGVGVRFLVSASAAGFYNAAAWNPAGNGTTDDTAILQAAINHAHDNNADLFIDAGKYLVIGLTIPGQVTGTDERGKSFRIFGQGSGEPFVVNNLGTTIISATDAPTIADILDTNPSSNGTFVLENMRIQGNTDSGAVIKLDSFYGLSKLRNLTIYNEGEGDGLEITYTATTEIDTVYLMNSDTTVVPLFSARTGVGVRYAPSHDAGLFTMNKVTMRGWHTGMIAGGGAAADFCTKLNECEFSTVYNGVHLDGTRKAVLDTCFFEGGETGYGILDEGNYTTVRDCLMFAGFATGIDASDTTTEGTLIMGNSISLGSVANSTGIDVASSAANGGNNKSLLSNTVNYTLGTDGVTGVKISGTDPRITHIGTFFNPRGGWTGTGTTEIDDQSVNGIMGFSTVVVPNGNAQIPMLSRGAVSLQLADTLTEADVTSNNMTVPDGSYFWVTSSTATTVQRLTAGPVGGRFVILRLTNGNTTFQDTAYLQMAGNFSGPGTLTFVTTELGGETYAFEVSRAAT